MKFLKVLKILCDICFYLTFTNFLGVLLGGTSLLLTLPVFAVSSYLVTLLSKKGVLKYTPLILLGACFLIVPLHIVNIVILTPIFAYMVYAAYKIEKDITKLSCMNQLKLYAKISCGFILIPILLGMMSYAGLYFVPYTAIFFVCIFLIMRLLRHDDEVLNKHRFKLINISVAIVAIIVIMFLVSNASVNLLTSFYFNALAPGFLFALTWFLEFISNPITFIRDGRHMSRRGPIARTLEYEFDGLQGLGIEYSDELSTELFVPSNADIVLTYVFFIVIAAVIVMIVIKLLRNEKYQHLAPAKGINKIREKITGKKVIPEVSIKHPIRELYRKYLLFCKDKGIDVEKFTTSMDIEKKSATKFKNTETNEMREIYIKIRYGEKDFNRHELKKIKELLGDLKKSNP